MKWPKYEFFAGCIYQLGPLHLALDSVPLLFLNAYMSDDDLPYRVELWDDNDAHVEEVIALVSDYATARSAFDEAVKRRPGKLITLRQRTRVLADSRGKA